MMKEKKKGLLQRGLMVAVSALTIVAGAGTVLAYKPMQSSDMSVGESIENFDLDFTSLNATGESAIDPSDIDFSINDKIFTDFAGNQIPVLDSTVPYALCTHSMINGYLNNHSSNSSGGCTVYVYKCQRCEKCGYLANAVYQYKVVYPTCPHK